MFKGQLYATTTEDVLNNIDNISLDDVKGLYDYIMNNAKGEIVMSAPFEKNPELNDTLMNEVNNDFPMLCPSKSSLFNGFVLVKNKKLLSWAKRIWDDRSSIFPRDVKKSPALNFVANGAKKHPGRENIGRSMRNNSAIFNHFFIFIESLILLGFGLYNTSKI